MWYLYIWQGDGVLESYGTGLVVCLAPSLLHAVSVLKKHWGKTYTSLPFYHPSEIIAVGQPQDQVVQYWYCYGSA